MNRFRKLGFLDYNGHIEVHSSLLTAVLHDKPHVHDKPPLKKSGLKGIPRAAGDR